MFPWQHFFLFLGFMNIFMGSLLSIPLHRLELIDNTWQQVLPWHFFLFLGLTNIFMGSLLFMPLHRLKLISFLATPDKCCHGTLCCLGIKIFLEVLYIPNLCTHWSRLVFRLYIATSIAMGTLFFVSWTDIFALHFKPLHE